MNIGIVTTWFERCAAYVSRQVLEIPHLFIYAIYARGWEKHAVNDPRWHDDKVTWGKQGLVATTMSMGLDYCERRLSDKELKLFCSMNSFRTLCPKTSGEV